MDVFPLMILIEKDLAGTLVTVPSGAPPPTIPTGLGSFLLVFLSTLCA